MDGGVVIVGHFPTTWWIQLLGRFAHYSPTIYKCTWRHEHLHGQTSLQRQNVEGLAAAAAIAAACADGEMCCKQVQTPIVARLKTAYIYMCVCVDVG